MEQKIICIKKFPLKDTDTNFLKKVFLVIKMIFYHDFQGDTSDTNIIFGAWIQYNLGVSRWPPCGASESPHFLHTKPEAHANAWPNIRPKPKKIRQKYLNECHLIIKGTFRHERKTSMINYSYDRKIILPAFFIIFSGQLTHTLRIYLDLHGGLKDLTVDQIRVIVRFRQDRQ